MHTIIEYYVYSSTVLNFTQCFNSLHHILKCVIFKEIVFDILGHNCGNKTCAYTIYESARQKIFKRDENGECSYMYRIRHNNKRPWAGQLQNYSN